MTENTDNRGTVNIKCIDEVDNIKGTVNVKPEVILDGIQTKFKTVSPKHDKIQKMLDRRFGGREQSNKVGHHNNHVKEGHSKMRGGDLDILINKSRISNHHDKHGQKDTSRDDDNDKHSIISVDDVVSDPSRANNRRTDNIRRDSPGHTDKRNHDSVHSIDRERSPHSSGHHRNRGESYSESDTDSSKDSDDEYVRPLTEDEIREKKREILYKLERFNKKGIPTKHMTLSDDLRDLEDELDRVTREIEIDRNLIYYKKALTFCCSSLEFLNKRFDPLDVNLDGWSEEIYSEVNKGEYDDIFEELHNKYRNRIKVAPEFRLLFAVAGSAFYFHIRNTMFSAATKISGYQTQPVGYSVPENGYQPVNNVFPKQVFAQNQPRENTQHQPEGGYRMHEPDINLEETINAIGKTINDEVKIEDNMQSDAWEQGKKVNIPNNQKKKKHRRTDVNKSIDIFVD